VDARDAIGKVFSDAPYIAHLGMVLDDIGPGWCETSLPLQAWHLQQTGVVHAGVLAAVADHTSGAAASIGLGAGEYILTAEYKINLLRAARGERLVCRAEVLKPGRRLVVVEAEVWSEHAGQRSLVAKFNATMAVVRPD
jgi:uncharacterized protein (TIGR00369 family)